MVLTINIDYIPRVPILIQFPPEILLKVLGHLDAIWLFQVEAACSQIRLFLQSSAGNRVWYDAIPAALLAQPEHFQSERDVQDVQLHRPLEAYSVMEIDASQVSPMEIMSLVAVGENVFRYRPKSDLKSIYFRLPALRELSGLWKDVDLWCGARHPRRGYRNIYPFVKSISHHDQTINHYTRKRTLALGGPFDIAISYRRELLGHLHYDERCYICYESFSEDTTRMHRFGMQFCQPCLKSSTVEPIDTQKVPGLRRLLEQASNGIWHPSRFPSAAGQGYWLPQVDEILRSFLGIDYGTIVAKQQYLEYFYAATTPEVEKGLCAAKREARGLIVQEAKKLWDAPKGFEKATTDDIDRLRSSFAPTSKLTKFLFPDHLLHVEAIPLPHDTEALWLADHTEGLQTVNEIRTFMRSPDRLVAAARTMLLDLIRTKARVTTLVQAAHEWHVNRLSASLAFEQLVSRRRRPRNRATRFNVVLEKLHLMPAVTQGIRLTPAGSEKAKKVLTRLIESSCIECPRTRMLAPRGIDGIVGHTKKYHNDVFWSGNFELKG